MHSRFLFRATRTSVGSGEVRKRILRCQTLTNRITILRAVLAALVAVTLSVPCQADDIESEIAAATRALSTTTYDLVYKLTDGEKITYEVEHLATADTQIQGTRQQSKSTTKSRKVWNVKEATEKSITFEYFIEDVEMMQKEDGRDEVRYDSKTDEKPPAAFQSVADRIGKVLATITIDHSGNVIKRDRGSHSPDLGFGGPVVPLPPKAVKLDHTWSEKKKLQLRDKNKLLKEVRIQIKYRLERVKSGVATISVRTEVLTAIDDPVLESQLVQQLSNGKIRFDIDAGRVLSKQLDWTESVIGFNGPNSNMKYLARFTEKLVANRVAKRNDPKKRFD